VCKAYREFKEFRGSKVRREYKVSEEYRVREWETPDLQALRVQRVLHQP
jgi:hypothetical protein